MREYLERQIVEGSAEELDEAALLAAGDEPLLQKVAAARQRLEQLAHASELWERGWVLRRQSKLSDAEAAFREALAIREKHLGVEHGDIALTLNELAPVVEQQGNLVEAEKAYRKALVIFLANPRGLLNEVVTAVAGLAHVLRQQGKLADVEAVCTDIGNGVDVECLGDIAWRLAVSPNSDSRDGQVAEVLAEKAVALTGRTQPFTLEILAAAYAEQGDFERAAMVQKEATALYGVLGDVSRGDSEDRLRLYETKSPYRFRGGF
jgi:tetratricopeptide (TPR) repeat protein